MRSFCLMRFAKLDSKSARIIHRRNVVSIAYRQQRKLSSQPYQSALSFFGVIFTITPCVYVGGKLAKSLAELFDEWSIFSYEEDDEDD